VQKTPADIRRFNRAPIETRVNCLGPGTFFSDFAVNISEGGMMLQAISEVEPGCDLEIQFSIPGVGKTIKATGEVVWARKNPGGSGRVNVGIGVRFKRIEKNELALIRDYIGEKGTGQDL
jgi:uncharacterized protein (TIGR02266 family)